MARREGRGELTSKLSQRDWESLPFANPGGLRIFDAGAATPVPWTLDQKAALAIPHRMWNVTGLWRGSVDGSLPGATSGYRTTGI